MHNDLNLGNSIFPGFNDHNGLMICGYEWGCSKKDEEDRNKGLYQEPQAKIECTFANKARRFGKRAWKWRYDNTIKKWFSLWGFPLDDDELGGSFEKSITQTNWAYTDGNHIDDYGKFITVDQINNFIHHVEQLCPKIIIFIGSRLINYLNRHDVLPRFQQVMGEITDPHHYVQKPFNGKRLKIHFQKFEHCQIVCLPHTSARGLTDSYIALFQPEMTKILSTYKQERGF